MIRCGGFCLSFDEETAKAAAKSAKRILAAGTRVRLSEGAAAGLGLQSWLVSLEYEGSGEPVVHGFVGAEPESGEFTMLSKKGKEVQARRDFCGTRPLYLGNSKRWIASDHRFFPGDASELVSPGSVLSLPAETSRLDRSAARRPADSFDEAAAELASLIQASVRLRAAGKRRVAISFSGGLDSSIIAHCAAAHCKVVACSVSAEGSTDSRVAEDSASIMGLEFSGAKVDQKSLAREARGLSLPFEPSPMDRSLWCIYSIASRLAAESGAEAIMLGQLADELFGGYAKYESALRLDGEAQTRKMMSDDVALCGTRGFIRDEAACRQFCEPRFPFAEKEVARLGGSLPVSFKIRDGVRKAVLRKAAIILGVPAEIVGRPKKAAQYSSGVQKLLG